MKSFVKGVGFASVPGTWKVQFKVKGKSKYIGTFKTKEEAEEVAIRERKKYFPNEKSPYKVWGEMENKWEDVGDYINILIESKGETLRMKVDREDFELLRETGRNVCVSFFKSNNSHYAFITLEGKHVFVHRFLMNPTDGQVVDHINHDTLDNRRDNLRNVSVKENLNNRKPKPKVPKKRVNFRPYESTKGKPTKYSMYVKINKEWKYSGTYLSRIDGLRVARQLLAEK